MSAITALFDFNAITDNFSIALAVVVTLTLAVILHITICKLIALVLLDDDCVALIVPLTKTIPFLGCEKGEDRAKHVSKHKCKLWCTQNNDQESKDTADPNFGHGFKLKAFSPNIWLQHLLQLFWLFALAQR